MPSVKDILLAGISILFCLLMVEVGYRFYLSNELQTSVNQQIEAARLEADTSSSFTVYESPSPWVYNEAYGYDYRPGNWLSATIEEGQIAECERIIGANDFGNHANTTPDYWDSDIRIMFLGSSYTQTKDVNDHTPIQLLEQALSEQLGASVAILNFSRDASGLLLSFDLAAAKIEELKPDLLIFGFNSTALGYSRHWRTTVPVTEDVERLLFMLDPLDASGALPPPERVVGMPQLASPLITQGLCDRGAHQDTGNDNKNSDDLEVAVEQLIEARRRIIVEPKIDPIAINFWRTDVSFVWNAINYDTPYADMKITRDNTVFNSLRLLAFDEDPRAADAISAVVSSDIPMVFLHIPTYEEMKGSSDGHIIHGRAGVDPTVSKALLQDLQRLTGRDVHHLYQWYSETAKSSPRDLVVSESDSHPTKTGVPALAASMETALKSIDESAQLLTKWRNSNDANSPQETNNAE
ncbi:hypothetical protein NBRC116588_10450 [Pyruvatibacter sp. HU-CL02332]|uniref:hypothetical protein n=1 Tax=Pyruvatibacter sp. HU-CL02332 TaxID=3127650 RepID=UPI003108276C